MQILEEYQIEEAIGGGAGIDVYRTLPRRGERTVIVKHLPLEYAPGLLLRLKNEYDILSGFEPGLSIKPLGFKEIQGGFIAIYEDGGASLKTVMTDRAMDIPDMLDIGIRVADILAKIHTRRIIHKNIKPSSVLIGENGGRDIRLVNFENATRLDREEIGWLQPDVLEGNLSYISPEQTGRLNRQLDFRSDFYSLGVLFYEILTGRLPFRSQSPVELVHEHLAATPPLVRQVNPRVPEVLSEIVGKLMSKDAEARYQSAAGLKFDLETCRTRYHASGRIEPFEIGKRDISNQFRLPLKIYGREEETRRLLADFERAARGASRLFMVAGYSGIGKSVFVRETYRPITRQNGQFITGKFDQFQQNIPFHAISQAFRELMRLFLTEPDDKLARWREKIRSAVGINGQVLVDVIPELVLIIGPQEPVPAIGPGETLNRFNMTFRRFINALADRDHPLVLFLDDLQWADTPSLELVNTLITDPESRSLLLIGAYRDNEVDATHPLSNTLKSIEGAGGRMTRITLGGLNMDHVREYTRDTLPSADPERLEILSQRIKAKTDGNPFFMGACFNRLFRDGQITFNHDRLAWQCSRDCAAALGLADNVIDFMIGNLVNLPDVTRQTLSLAACLGNTFTPEMLCIVGGGTLSDHAVSLQPAILDGLLVPLGKHASSILLNPSAMDRFVVTDLLQLEIRFQHDRVQQAAYKMIPESERARLHLKVGRLLLESCGPESRIFEITGHLNKAADLIADAAGIRELTELNLKAGRKAKENNAHHTAIDYFATGIRLLGPTWEDHHAILFELHKLQGECEYLTRNFRKSETLLDIALEKARSTFEKASIYIIQIQQLTGAARYREAVLTLIDALNLFEADIPALEQGDGMQRAMEAELKQYERLMQGKTIDELRNLPLAESDEIRLCQQIMGLSVIPLGMYAEPHSLTLILTKMVNLAIRHGLTTDTPLGLCNFAGGVLAAGLKQYHDAYRIGRLALELNETRLPNPATRPKIYHFFAYLSLIEEPLEKAEGYFWKNYLTALEVGDINYGNYGLNCHLRFIFPRDLSRGREASYNALAYMRKINEGPMAHLVEMYIGFIRCLRGETVSPGSLDHGDFTESAYRDAFEGVSPILTGLYKRYKLLALAILDMPLGALPLVHDRGAVVRAMPFDTFHVGEYYLACGLVISSLCPEAENNQKAAYLAILEECAREVRFLADISPVNYEPACRLLEALLAFHDGRDFEYLGLLDRSIATADLRAFPMISGIASELAARFYLDKGLPKPARPYMIDARNRFAKWGATAKVRQLEETWPDLLPVTSPGSGHQPVGVDQLDLASILKASQAISREIEFNRLLETLMKIVIENAGARQGSLILNEGGNLKAVIHSTPETNEIPSTPWPVATLSDRLAVSLVTFSARTRETVCLSDATGEDRFANDPYIVKVRPKSILCFPVLHKGELGALIYLENQMSSGVFTPGRMEVLNMLSSQIAISLENARLFDDRENSRRALLASEEKFRSIFENSPMGMVHFDHTGITTDCNDPISDILGAPKNAILGQDTLKIVRDDKMRAALASALSGGKRQYEGAYTSVTGGRTTPLRATFAPILNADGRVDGALGILEDISERLEAERKNQELETRLQQVQKMEAIGTLAGGIAHDFNNILSIILGSTELALMDSGESPQLRKNLQQTMTAALRARDLVRQILDFSRKSQPEKSVIDLVPLVEESLRLIRASLPATIQFRKRIRCASCRVYTNGTQISQILLNLCTNAAHAMNFEGQLDIMLEYSRIDPNEEKTDTFEKPAETYAVLTVRDSGCGIPREDLNRIFDPYFTTREVGKGSGLGLAVVYGIVQSHGGEIKVHSQVGLGTTFTVYLPGTEKKTVSQPAATSPPTGDKERILFIDDEPMIVKLVNIMLKRLGYDVCSTDNPEEGLEHFRSAPDDFDLVITDMTMPSMTGARLAAEMLKIRPDIPIIICTGHSELIDSESAGKLGVAKLLMKPLTSKSMAEAIRDILNGKPGTSLMKRIATSP